jgi:anti-sigma B factor antagonist
VDLSLNARTEGDRALVEVSGTIDMDSSPRLRAHLVNLVGRGCHHLVVDMRQVDFIDSAGLRVLVGVLKQVWAQQGSMHLVITEERILKIFRITNLTKSFPIHASVAQAMAADPGQSQA